MIHKFSEGDLYFAIDICSGAVHQITEVAYNVLDHYPKESTIETVKSLMDHFEQDEIKDAIGQIDELIESGYLFTDQPKMASSNQMQGSNMILKAIRIDLASPKSKCSGSKHQVMSLQTAMNAVDYLVKNSGDRTVIEIDFFAGENLIDRTVLTKTIEYARMLEESSGKRFSFNLATDGMLISIWNSGFINEQMDSLIIQLPKESNQGEERIRFENLRDLIRGRGEKTYYIIGTDALCPRTDCSAENVDENEGQSKTVKALADNIRPAGYYDIATVLRQPNHVYQRYRGGFSDQGYMSVCPDGKVKNIIGDYVVADLAQHSDIKVIENLNISAPARVFVSKIFYVENPLNFWYNYSITKELGGN